MNAILAIFCSQMLYFAVVLSGTFFTAQSTAFHSSFVGAIWMIVGTYAGCLAGALVASRENWKLVIGICALAAIFWARPENFQELAGLVAFAGSIAASLAAYFTALRLPARKELNSNRTA